MTNYPKLATIAILVAFALRFQFPSPIDNRKIDSIPGSMGATVASWNVSSNKEAHLEGDTSVCIIGSIRMYSMENNTLPYVRARMAFLRDVALRSFQTSYTCKQADKVKMFHVVIPISGWESHYNSWEEVETLFGLDSDRSLPLAADDCKVKVTVGIKAGGGKQAVAALDAADCKWVATVRLDADDSLTTGYLDFVVDHVIPKLATTKTKSGYPWLGALVASRSVAGFFWGDHRCTAFSSSPQAGAGYQGGVSIGQTRLYRRDVHTAVGKPIRGGNHVYELGALRTLIAKQFLNMTNYQSPFGANYVPDVDARDEEIAQVKAIEPSIDGFGYVSGVYTKTPLSGTFPWLYSLEIPRCTRATWREITSAFPAGSMDFLLQSPAIKLLGNLSVYDVCRSNVYFLKRKRQSKNWNYARTCEEFEKEWQRLKENAAAE